LAKVVKDPKILSPVFTKDEHDYLKKLLLNYKDFPYDPAFSRYTASDSQVLGLKDFADSLIPLARETFDSKTLQPTYTLFAHYEGQDPEPSLYKHKDDNACTYTIDLCLYQNDTWDLWVDDKPYTLYPNQALAYYGNDQLHWREKFPDPKRQHVAMIFFHFAEPDHWWFTEGPEYLSVIRKEITQEAWELRTK
jgi:hypothetical protein